MLELQEFQQYQLSQNEDGSPLELSRTDEEVVCLGFDTERRFFVEIHVLSDDFGDEDARRDAFYGRIGKAKRVRHANVAAVFDAGNDEGTPYYVTELVDGERIDRYLRRCAPLPEPVVVAAGLQLVAGLEALGDAPDLLAAADLFTVRVLEGGEGESALVFKITDFGLNDRGPVAVVPRDTVRRALSDVGRTLIAGVTGRFPGPEGVEEAMEGMEPGVFLRAIARLARGELSTFDDAARLLEALVGERDVRAGPARGISREMVPERLLTVQFRERSQVAHDVGEEFDVGLAPGGRDRGYSFPLRSDGGEFLLRQLPPARLCQGKLSMAVQRVMSAGAPFTVEVTALWGTPRGELYLESHDRLLTVAGWVRRRGGLGARDLARILRAVHEALVEAGEAGLELWGFSTSTVFVGVPDGRVELGGVRMQCHPTTEMVISPGRFTPGGVAPERATVAPDDLGAFLRFGFALAAEEPNPAMRGALGRFFNDAATKTSSWKGSVPAKRERLLSELDSLVEDVGLAVAEPEPAVLPVPDFAGDDLPAPGVAEALFGESATLEEWNPVARSALEHGSAKAYGGDGIIREVANSRFFFWSVVVLLLVASAALWYFGWEELSALFPEF